MATTTPNFGWQVPTSTDYVKDGAVAIETLGDAIDASLVDLKGGTTGQVLSKATNTDMDFAWVTPDDADAIQNTIVDAKGDLIAATAADTPARLAVGTNGQVLTADSSTATGLKWAAAPAGGWTELSSTNLANVNTVTVSNISQAYKDLKVVIEGADLVTPDNYRFRVNGITSNTYLNQWSSVSGIGPGGPTSNTLEYWRLSSSEAISPSNENTQNVFVLTFPAYSLSVAMMGRLDSQFFGNASSIWFRETNLLGRTGTGAITSVTLFTASSNNWAAGTIKIYGMA